MNKHLSDIFFASITLILGAFFIIPQTRDFYNFYYNMFPLPVSFLKFAILATGGEMLVQRIKVQKYVPVNFGLLPKAMIWGLLGILIYWIFGIFSVGVSATFQGLSDTFIQAFIISLFMNVFFAPVLMIIHTLTDSFIVQNSGRFPIRKWNTQILLEGVDWKRFWGFVCKKTIPFFWIPAHTITFLLPQGYRTLFAAFLSAALGILLTITTKKRVPDKTAS